jgi:IS1 family transposase
MRSGPSSKKKEKHCDPSDPADQDKGDQWDCTAVDAPSRFIVAAQIGKRIPTTLQALVDDFAARTEAVPPDLITTDGYQTYPPLLMSKYGMWVEPPQTGRPGRPRQGYLEWPSGSVYATVTKTYKEGVVKSVRRELVYGTEQDLAAALEASPVSQQINTAFVERQNGTDRGHNPRKVRKTYSFSKKLLLHLAVSWWVIGCYNYHDLHRSLRQQLPDGTYQHRTPAMALGLQTHPLSIGEFMRTQVVGRVTRQRPTLADFRPSVERVP